MNNYNGEAMNVCICVPDPHSPFWSMPEGRVDCDCGELAEAMGSLTCAQHHPDCALMKAYREWLKTNDAHEVGET